MWFILHKLKVAQAFMLRNTFSEPSLPGDDNFRKQHMRKATTRLCFWSHIGQGVRECDFRLRNSLMRLGSIKSSYTHRWFMALIAHKG